MSHRSSPTEPVQIDLWKFSLDGNPDDLEGHLNDLVGEEKDRITQGIFPELGQRATRSRLGLRWILASYLNCLPQQIKLIIGEHGKPELDHDSPSSQKLHFNLSHCGDRALLAVSWNTPLGADLERIRMESPIEDLAERCFGDQERQTWLELPQEIRRTAFFHLWVQKEAMVKAQGDGMTLPLRLFSGIADPGIHEGPIRSELPEIGTDLWRFHAETFGENLRSAIVFQGKSASIHPRDAEELGLSRW